MRWRRISKEWKKNDQPKDIKEILCTKSLTKYLSRKLILCDDRSHIFYDILWNGKKLHFSRSIVSGKKIIFLFSFGSGKQIKFYGITIINSKKFCCCELSALSCFYYRWVSRNLQPRQKTVPQHSFWWKIISFCLWQVG